MARCETREAEKLTVYSAIAGCQASIHQCYSLIRFIWPQRGLALCVWKGFMCMMDVIVRNAKVNTQRSFQKKKKDFLISKAPPMYHPCNLTLPPSVITFCERTTSGIILRCWRRSVKRLLGQLNRPVTHTHTHTHTHIGFRFQRLASLGARCFCHHHTRERHITWWF